MQFRIERLKLKIEKFTTKTNKTMSQRLFIGSLIFINLIIIFGWGTSPLPVLSLIALSSAFIYLVKKMRNYIKFNKKLKIYMEFLQRQDSRRSHNYVGPNYKIELQSNEQEELCNDLNLLGPKSVFSVLDECITTQGQITLASWLTQPEWNLKQILNRQETLRQLSTFKWLLIKFRIISQTQSEYMELSDLKKDIQQSLATPSFYKMLTYHFIVFPLAWIVMGLALAGVINLNPILPFMFYLVFSLVTRHHVEHSFSKAQNFAYQLHQLAPIFQFIEKQFDSMPFREHFTVTLNISPSTQLRKLNRLVSFLSSQGHPMVHFVLNSIAPWDYFFSFLVERWRELFAATYNDVIGELNDFEATMSCTLFTIYQTQSFPKLSENPNLTFTNAYHPLIDKKRVVANDFSLPPDSNTILITGSNMSGKSTFLRTIGINQLLALMGCPVFASEMSTFVAPVKTCLKVTDSIEEGLSTFYFEVKKVAGILNAARADKKFIYLIDEIFRGTNNRERLIGSQRVIEELISHKQIIGFISTHDLELTTLAEKFSSLSNWHFKDDVDSNELVFDYLIHKGPCPTTNALKILAAEGIL